MESRLLCKLVQGSGEPIFQQDHDTYNTKC